MAVLKILSDRRISPPRRLRAALLGAAATLAAAGPAFAGGAAAQEDLEDRVNALEQKLDLILQRLETQDDRLTAEEEATVREAAGVASAASVAAADAPETIPTPAAPVAMAAAERPTDGFMVGNTKVSYSGYVKLDTIFSKFSGGTLPTTNIGRDFYIPALTPVGGEDSGWLFDFNPRETRFLFKTETDVAGRTVGTHIEFDFQVTTGGDERVSNSWVPRMRQAFITVDNWLFGQAWSTFQDVAALPDSVDFIGPSEGTVFERGPLIRYSRGGWQFALEQPETEITRADGTRFLPGTDAVPDGVIRYNYKRDWGHLTGAAIVRYLRYNNEELVPGVDSDSAIGYGVSASGKVKTFGRDNIAFMATYGSGIGRYVGVNIVNDAAVEADGSLDTIATYSGFFSYRHFWSKKWRSSITGSYFKADNPVELTGGTVTDQSYSIRGNLIWEPIEKLDVGVEYSYANRKVENGDDGSLNRLQFMTKFKF